MSGLSYLLPSYDKIIMFFSFCESFKIKNDPICGSHSRILPSTGLPLRLLDRLLEEEGNLEVLPRRRRQDGGVVEARAEEAGSAGHWAVLEVDRRPGPAPPRRASPKATRTARPSSGVSLTIAVYSMKSCSSVSWCVSKLVEDEESGPWRKQWASKSSTAVPK